MYFDNITNNELKQFHKSIKLTASYQELLLILFDKTQANKLIPLFYYDNVTANDKITILDDLLFLYVNNEDLKSIYFSSSNNANNDFDVYAETSTILNRRFLKLHFFDKVSKFNLNTYNFDIKDSNDILLGNYDTDKYGNCIIEINEDETTFTIISTTTKTSKEITV